MSAAGKIVSKLVGLTAAVAVAGGGFAWWQYRANESQRIIEAQAREIEYLNNVASRLTMEERKARVVVTGQKRNDAGQLETNLLFLEIGPDGNALPAKSFTALGDRVHFDAFVIKFEDQFVKEGDPLRGKSIAIWDKVYGMATEPENGQVIDERGLAPRVYEGDAEEIAATGLDAKRRAFEDRLWQDFWELASDADAAKNRGVRVAQGEGVNTKLEPDKVYELTLEADGGLNIYAREMPPEFRAMLEAIRPRPGT